MVDKAYVGNFLGECFVRQGHLGSMLAAVEPALEGKPIARVEAACASGGIAIAACVDALQASADVALAAGVEIETSVPGQLGVEYVAYAAHYEKQRHLDHALFPHLFGRRARAYKETFGADQRDLARAVVQAYTNAKRNPRAQMQIPAPTLDEVAEASSQNRAFLQDERYRDHIRLLDCTNFTDGASAVILATEAGLERLGVDRADCTELLSYGHTVRALGAETDATQMSNMRDAAAIAYRDAGLTPGDLDVAEVHDCFTVAFHQAVEALGLAALGGASRRLADGDFALDGAIPVNTGGGLLGFGHPVGATGTRLVITALRELRRRGGTRALATLCVGGGQGAALALEAA